MSDLSGGLGNVGGDINKQGGDALGVSYSGAMAHGHVDSCGGGGSYYGGDGSSATSGDMMGAGAGAYAGPGIAQGGDGGTDNTSIGDITINT